MDTHSVVCSAHRTALHREITRRYRCREHHLPDLIVTETSHRPPYRKRGVGRRAWAQRTDPWMDALLWCWKCSVT